MEERKNLTFNELPQAVGQIGNRLDNIEKLLQSFSNPTQPQKPEILYTLGKLGKSDPLATEKVVG